MANIFNFESLVDCAHASLCDNPDLTPEAGAQELRSQIEKTSSFLGRVWFRISHRTSIGSHLKKAVSVAQSALRGYKALGPYLFADIGNNHYSKELFDHRFEAHLQENAGIDRTPAKVGKCWEEFHQRLEDEAAAVFSKYGAALARRRDHSAQRKEYRECWENNDPQRVYNSFHTQLKKDPASIFYRYCIAHSDRSVLEIAQKSHNTPSSTPLFQACHELDSSFSSPEQEAIWREISPDAPLGGEKLSRVLLKRTLRMSGKTRVQFAKEFFLQRLREGKSKEAIQTEFEALLSLLADSERAALQQALLPDREYSFDLAFLPSHQEFLLLDDLEQSANRCHTDPKEKRSPLFHSFTYLSQAASLTESDIPVCLRPLFSSLPPANDADKAFAQELRSVEQRFRDRLDQLTPDAQTAVLRALLPDADNVTVADIPDAVHNTYYRWITKKRERGPSSPSEELMQQNLLIGIPRIKLIADAFGVIKEQKGEETANQILEIAMTLLGGGEACRGGLQGWISFVSSFHPGRWEMFRKQFERSQDAYENPEVFKDRMKALKGETEALAQADALPIDFKATYPQIWKSLILPRFESEETAQAQFSALAEGLNSQGLRCLIQMFEARALEFDEEIDLKQELQLLARHTDFPTPSNPGKYIQTMFPRLWAEHFRSGYPSDQAAAEAVNGLAPARATLFDTMMGFLRLRLERSLEQIGMGRPKIASLIDEEIQKQLVSPNPIFAGLEAVKGRMKELELGCQLERLRTDRSLLDANQDPAQTLINLQTKYPRIWKELVLPAYLFPETAGAVFTQTMGIRFSLETLVDFVEYSIKEAVVNQLKKKGFSFDQILQLWQAARQSAQAPVSDRIETARELRRTLQALVPVPEPLRSIFGPLDSAANLEKAAAIAAAIESELPLSPEMELAIGNLADKMKDQEAAEAKYLRTPLLIAHLPEPYRKCIQYKHRIYSLAKEFAIHRFHAAIEHPERTQEQQKIAFNPSLVTEQADRRGPLKIYQPFTADAHRLPIIEFRGNEYAFKNGMIPYSFLRALDSSLGSEEALTAQSILRSDEVNAGAEIFTGSWTREKNRHFLMIPRFERMKLVKFFNGSSSGFSLSGEVELRLVDQHSGGNSFNAPPASQRKIHVEYRFLQNRKGEWIRSKPIWRLVEQAPALLAPANRAEEMERLLEDPAVNRKLGEAAADPDKTKTPAPIHSAESGLIIGE